MGFAHLCLPSHVWPLGCRHVLPHLDLHRSWGFKLGQQALYHWALSEPSIPGYFHYDFLGSSLPLSLLDAFKSLSVKEPISSSLIHCFNVSEEHVGKFVQLFTSNDCLCCKWDKQNLQWTALNKKGRSLSCIMWCVKCRWLPESEDSSFVVTTEPRFSPPSLIQLWYSKANCLWLLWENNGQAKGALLTGKDVGGAWGWKATVLMEV